jgi:hypothetical protein
VHAPGFAGVDVAQRHLGAVGPVVEADDLGAQLHPGGAERAQVVQ